ncbi:MAG: hypothetical protein D6721_05855 [Gammaproteobacteria bacterium]|nr:MAG: hypothetical protein D6721_05855 [Gammaproteobacteria bacterium]
MRAYLLLLALFALLAYQVEREPPPVAPEPRQPGTKTADPVPPRLPRPRAVDLEALLARPLFSPTRRPPHTSRHAPRPGNDPRFRVTGIVRGASGRLALVQVVGRPGTLEVREGMRLEGWTVEQVRAEGVRLVADDGRTQWLPLYPPPGTAVNAPQPRQAPGNAGAAGRHSLYRPSGR